MKLKINPPFNQGTDLEINQITKNQPTNQETRQNNGPNQSEH
jgi:hypothetical protein